MSSMLCIPPFPLLSFFPFLFYLESQTLTSFHITPTPIPINAPITSYSEERYWLIIIIVTIAVSVLSVTGFMLVLFMCLFHFTFKKRNIRRYVFESVHELVYAMPHFMHGFTVFYLIPIYMYYGNLYSTECQ